MDVLLACFLKGSCPDSLRFSEHGSTWSMRRPLADGSSTHPRSTSAEELCCHRTARAIHQDGKGHQCAQTRSSQLAWPVQRLRQRHHKQRLGPGCRTHSESLPCVSPVRRSGAHQERRARNDRHIPAVPGEQSVGGWQERAPPRWRW